MSRIARLKSNSNIYHIMLRGINRQQIFYDNEDYFYFIKQLDRFKKPCGYKLYAYCLMGNHVHLLLKEGSTMPIGEVIKHIGGAFVYWYNLKYERSGHLFQDRFRSEPVESRTYLGQVFRYILRNPVKAGICCKPEDYQYSSAKEYLLGEKGITNTGYISDLIGEDALYGFVNIENDDECLEIDENARKGVTDETAIKIIKAKWGNDIPAVGKPGERTALNKAIKDLVKSGISMRQLSRLTGISIKIILSAIKKE